MRARASCSRLGSIGATIVLTWAASVSAQGLSQRGFVEMRGGGFPRAAVNDPQRNVGDMLVRQEVFAKPTPWFELAAGLDLRANSYEQVEGEWRLDVADRGVRRPRASVRRLSAGLAAGGFRLDVGKQFVRWGRADITYPTDRFAPRDALNVLDPQLLPVLGVRPSLQVGSETFEVVWLPRFTPSRIPLFNQRWTVVPEEARGLVLIDGGAEYPTGTQIGGRWRHTGRRFETAVSVFDGNNHQPNIDVRVQPDRGLLQLTRTYPAIRMIGVDGAVPTPWFTLKSEAAYVTARSGNTDEYVLYVVEIERQAGEWLVDVGYVGEVVTAQALTRVFAPDRGIAGSVIGRAVYTVDPRRDIAFEGAVRRRGEGVYAKAEFSQTVGAHWRVTLAAVGVDGEDGDFLGQYNRNSHVSLAFRYSY